MQKKMEADLIRQEDAEAVIAQCEETGRYIRNLDNEHRTGHLQRGYITYWIEYGPQADGFAVYNAYCHRMTIKEEGES